MPVVTAPAQIDATTADQLRILLFESAARGHITVAADMTRTQFCDSSGLGVAVNRERGAGEEHVPRLFAYSAPSAASPSSSSRAMAWM